MRRPDCCPVCSSSGAFEFVARTGVPAHQHQICATAEIARLVTKGDLALECCPHCGFVFNAAFDPAKLNYGAGYDNTQDHSPAFKAHVDGLVEHLARTVGMNNARIVEVGCGQGSFLRALVSASPGSLGYGFDPSFRGDADGAHPEIVFERRFYGADCSAILADVVVCRHVIEHVPDPRRLLEAIRDALGSSATARVFFETPCLEWILRHHVLWDLFYEHCSYFTADSLRLAFERSGFRVDKVMHVFSDQYLWLEATVQSGTATEAPGGAPGVAELARAYGMYEAELRARWLERLGILRQEGAVGVWGAGAKGVTFANLLDPDCELLDCVVDLNPGKQGRYVPGTGHPIVDYRQLGPRHVRNVILMNPNYRIENIELLQREGLEVTLIAG